MTLFELWFSQGICPVVGLLGRMVVLLLIFKVISILFSIVAKDSAKFVSFYWVISTMECHVVFKSDNHMD